MKIPTVGVVCFSFCVKLFANFWTILNLNLSKPSFKYYFLLCSNVH